MTTINFNYTEVLHAKKDNVYSFSADNDEEYYNWQLKFCPLNSGVINEKM